MCWCIQHVRMCRSPSLGHSLVHQWHSHPGAGGPERKNVHLPSGRRKRHTQPGQLPPALHHRQHPRRILLEYSSTTNGAAVLFYKFVAFTLSVSKILQAEMIFAGFDENGNLTKGKLDVVFINVKISSNKLNTTSRK